MEKTKIGITVGLAGAGLYFCGVMSIIPLLLLAGYVLLFEQNAWLRKTAVKVVVIVLTFTALRTGVDIIDGAFNSINAVFHIVNSEAFLSFPAKVTELIKDILDLIENIFLFVGGLQALSLKDLKIETIDKIVDKNM